jgi:hypothetical protein
MYRVFVGEPVGKRGGTCSTNGERRGTYRVFVGKPVGKRPL